MRITNYLKKQLNSSLVKKAIIKYADSNYKLMQQIITGLSLEFIYLVKLNKLVNLIITTIIGVVLNWSLAFICTKKGQKKLVRTLLLKFFYSIIASIKKFYFKYS